MALPQRMRAAAVGRREAGEPDGGHDGKGCGPVDMAGPHPALPRIA